MLSAFLCVIQCESEYYLSASGALPQTKLLYKGISAKWLIHFVVDVFTFLALLH